MAVILPFEEKFYREAGVDVTFVGHPLLDEVRKKYARPEALKRFGLREEAITVGILPGSRRSEVARLLPEMLRACRILTEKTLPAAVRSAARRNARSRTLSGISSGSFPSRST